MIGISPAFVRARELAERVARFKLPVLITGETGTGKEVFSRHIHEVSERPGPLIPVNCASLQESLAESELFGHAKGAFTGAATDKPGFFQLAHEGTLFLDEVAELPMVVQAKLLRVIEDGMVWKVGGRTGDLVDVRIVSATHRPMAEYVARGKFRRDLYERLTGFELHLPPLRDRGEDVILLAAHILANNETCQAVGPMSLDEGAQAALCAHTWPANIRELRRQLVRLAVEGVTFITADDLKLDAPVGQVTGHQSSLEGSPAHSDDLMDIIGKMCKNSFGVTSSDLQQATGLHMRKLQRVLSELTATGVLLRQPNGRTPLYRPAFH